MLKRMLRSSVLLLLFAMPLRGGWTQSLPETSAPGPDVILGNLPSLIQAHTSSRDPESVLISVTTKDWVAERVAEAFGKDKKDATLTIYAMEVPVIDTLPISGDETLIFYRIPPESVLVSCSTPVATTSCSKNLVNWPARAAIAPSWSITTC